jgi:hypothetical protein
MKLLLDLEQTPEDRSFTEFSAKEKRKSNVQSLVTSYFTK